MATRKGMGIQEVYCDGIKIGEIPVTDNKINDNVNSPSHYLGTDAWECIDMLRLVFGVENYYVFCLENAFKYIWRADKKNGQEDLHKAEKYLDMFADVVCTDSRLNDIYFTLRRKLEDITHDSH